MGCLSQDMRSHTPFRGRYAIPITSYSISFISIFNTFFSPSMEKSSHIIHRYALMPGKRTICAALRVMGLSNETNFSKYHHVLNRVEWSLLSAARILHNLIVSIAGSDNPLVFFIDETLERRKGPKIKAKGYYRDAGSSKKIVVKSSGLKWLTLAVSWRFPFSERFFALPFMTVLEPSAKSDKAAKKRHKSTLQLWKDNLIFRKHNFESFQENNKGLDELIGQWDKIPPQISWIRELIEHLAAA